MQLRVLFIWFKWTKGSNSYPKWPEHLFQVAFLWERTQKEFLNIFKSVKLLGAGSYQMDCSEHMQESQAATFPGSMFVQHTEGLKSTCWGHYKEEIGFEKKITYFLNCMYQVTVYQNNLMRKYFVML